MTFTTDYSTILPTDPKAAQLLLSDTSGDQGHTPYNRVLLMIDEDGKVSLAARTYWGGDGTPESEWHRRVLTYTLTPNADAEALRLQLDGGPLAILLDTVIAGHGVEWNGSNMVGTLTGSAREADEQLEMILSDFRTYDGDVASASEWLTGGVQTLTEAVEPGETAELLLARAEADGWLITDGLAGMQVCVEQATRERAEQEDDSNE